MKKSIICLIVVLCCANSVYARDYVKLQLKELKHAQKYETTSKYLNSVSESSLQKKQNETLKDPKILRVNNFKNISEKDYAAKLANDEKTYSTYSKNVFGKSSNSEYYKLYRISEKIIRANNLDFINWRIGIYRDPNQINAYNINMNYIAISTALYDTFKNNDNALALIIGNEMGHALLGHTQRKLQLLERLENLSGSNDPFMQFAYGAQRRRYLIESKNMEYAADIEGAKLALIAGYNLNDAANIMSFFTITGEKRELNSTHPNSTKRLKNLTENRKYFLDDEWKELGKYNIYNSEVLKVTQSSDWKSIIIEAPTNKVDLKKYYKPENIEQVLLRVAYTSYQCEEYKKSAKYFDDYFQINSKNAIAYLYASYVNEKLYKTTQKPNYLEKSKEYIKKAKSLDANNKYINEQLEDL